ncbi:hypothetical protein D3C72_2601910 [compost metagenome]
MDSSNVGIAIRMSVARISTASALPPMKPASSPIAPPKNSAISTASDVACNEVEVPYTVRV